MPNTESPNPLLKPVLGASSDQSSADLLPSTGVLMRTFHITPKTPHETLAKVELWTRYYNPRLMVARDMLANAKELEDGVVWPEIQDQIIAISGKRRYHSTDALARSVAGSLGSVASYMGWDMHSPEVVYMSTYHIMFTLGKRVQGLNERLALADERQFISDELRQKTLAKEKADAGRLGAFEKRIRQSLQEYAQQFLPPDDRYLQVLQSLLYSSHIGITVKQRNKIMDYIKQGNIDQAYAVIEEIRANAS